MGRFIVLIPAHDEQNAIAQAVRSALSVRTGHVEVGVLVVADNCSDRTAEVASAAGAEVIERNDPTRQGKGWALDFGIGHALDSCRADAVFIMDADSTVCADVFDWLQPLLESGCDCIQVRYEISNATCSWRTRLMAAAFDLRAHVQLLGRQALGLSTGLMGNGMCFTRALLAETGWPSTSITEDLEASAILVRRGYRIWYEPRARVAAEMPATAKSAGIQRFRWEVGQAACCIRWAPRLLAAAVAQRRIDPLAQAMAMLNPPLGLLVLAVWFGWAASALLAWGGGSVPAGLMWAWPTLLLALAVYLVGSLLRSGSPERVRDIVVSSPAYLLWKLWFYLSIPWRGRATKWVRTPRPTLIPHAGGFEPLGTETADEERLTARAGASPRPRERKYVVVSPVRDEGEYLQRTIDSMVAQTARPTTWIIVDDGSSDDTADIAARAARQHEWIRLLHRDDRGVRRVGRGVVEAFRDGLALVKLEDHDYLCKLDGDLEFGPEYFERLFEKFDREPRLGTASGKSWIVIGGRCVPERSSDDFSQGQTKLYRVECYCEIGGFVPEVMWDGIDCHRCRMFGWEAKSFTDEQLRFIHLRTMGSSFKSIFHGRMRWGRGQYFMGTHWLYALAMSGYRMFERPFIVGGGCILVGYVAASLTRLRQYDDRRFRRHLHRWQLSRLSRLNHG